MANEGHVRVSIVPVYAAECGDRIRVSTDKNGVNLEVWTSAISQWASCQLSASQVEHLREILRQGLEQVNKAIGLGEELLEMQSGGDAAVKIERPPYE